jgi:hypothetical protein
MAWFKKLRHKCAYRTLNGASIAMSSTADLLNSIRVSESGMNLAELLATHPDVARRTAQPSLFGLDGDADEQAIFPVPADEGC